MNLSVRFSITKDKKHVIAIAVVCSLAAGSSVLRNPRSPSGGAGTRPAGRLRSPQLETDRRQRQGPTENSSQLGIEEFYNDPLLTRLIHRHWPAIGS